MLRRFRVAAEASEHDCDSKGLIKLLSGVFLKQSEEDLSLRSVLSLDLLFDLSGIVGAPVSGMGGGV